MCSKITENRLAHRLAHGSRQPAVYAEMCAFARATNVPGDPLGDAPATAADCGSWMYKEACEWVNGISL